MTKYKTLAELKAAYDTGITSKDSYLCPLVLDNDDASVYLPPPNEECIFEMDPHQLLREALDLLGIPWDEV